MSALEKGPREIAFDRALSAALQETAKLRDGQPSLALAVSVLSAVARELAALNDTLAKGENHIAMVIDENRRGLALVVAGALAKIEETFR